MDSSGNVYIADTGNDAIKKWTVASNTVTTLASCGWPLGVAVDGAGNVYIATDFEIGLVQELPRAFVDPTPRFEGLAAGSGTLPVVLPANENLLPPFAPTSDQPWLTITGVTNGVVSFAFTATTTNRTAHITVLGQPIAVTQAAVVPPPVLIGPAMLGNGTFQFAFSNNTPGASFTVLTATNVTLPLANWAVAGTPTNTAPGLFQFSIAATNDARRFYRVRSP